MTELLTAAQMRAIERAAIDGGAVTGLELMERAGGGVVAAVFEAWPDLAAAPRRAVVLCGPGNNGGDGFVVARLLRQWGWEVEVFLYGDPARLPPDARTNCERWQGMGMLTRLGFPDLAPADRDRLSRALDGAGDTALVVDAIFGTGLTRPAPGLEALCAINAARSGGAGPAWVAVDVPTGLCSDSGRPLGAAPGAALRCDLAVTFHRPRLGHHLGDGPAVCGKVVVRDIGLDPRPGSGPAREGEGEGDPAVVRLVCGGAPLPRRLLRKPAHGHKYGHGHALILSGEAGRTGAARLAARAALRAGAGLVTLAVPPDAQPEVAAQVTAIMLRPIQGAEALARLLEDARFNAVCLGPGLGPGRARALVETVYAGLASGRSGPARGIVLDADALSAHQDAPEALFSLCRGSRTVLTPHDGEFARLFPDLADRLGAAAMAGPAYSRVDAARAAAARAGCVVLLKGPDTVIADPEGRCAVSSAAYQRAAPWLATAGSGDVLAGFITGLLARGFDPMRAAEVSAWLHVECARRFGPGLIAEDIPEQLPGVFRDLGL